MRIWICFLEALQMILLLLLSHCSITLRAVVAVSPTSSHQLSHSIIECDALLEFNNSFIITKDASGACDFFSNTSHPKTASWNKDTNCCSWDGVTCQAATNHVIGLDLSCSQLQGVLNSNSTLFLLLNLRRLNLAGNNFSGSGISSRFGIFTRMTHLNLSNSGFSGPIPLEMISRHLFKLISLDLSWLYDASGVPKIIEDNSFRPFAGNLTQLRELFLDGTNMFRVSLISLTNLSSTLLSLSLDSCSLHGVFPFDTFHSPNLRSLSLSDNYELAGTLSQINWTSSLVSLDLSSTGFHGSIPNSLGNLTALNYLGLSSSKFTGPIPMMLGNLGHLIHLDLSSNYLSGSMDFGVFKRLKNLQYLSLANNNLTTLSQSDQNYSFPMLKVLDLSGCHLTELPHSFTSLEELRELHLSQNMISGQIPEWIWRAPRDTLTTLHLYSNNFSGEIPSSICQMSSLETLRLQINILSGTIPGCLGNLTNLYELSLGHNQLRGPLPRSLSNCTRLRDLSIRSNGIDDTFPHWLNSTSSLNSLDLESNKFHGVIAISLPQLTSVTVADNKFSGQLPTDFGSLYSGDIDLSKNNFEGSPPVPHSTYYDISHNNFSGGISDQFCEATELTYINLSFNQLTGTIPHCFINFNRSILVLDLRANRFTGQIPEIFDLHNGLMVIRLSQNRLSGKLPRSLSYCENLEVLDLSNNELEGSFPYWSETLPNLKVLALNSNKFHGSVVSSNKTNIPFPKLHIFDLSDNKFSGALPRKYITNLLAMKDAERSGSLYIDEGSIESRSISIIVNIKGVETEMVKILTKFITIDFSSNLFDGEIPEDIGDLKALKGLNFSHNNLSGNIPSAMGNLSNLEWLDLSSNKFDGEIPGGLAKLSEISWLNLSNNQLVGQIPQGTQFDTFPHSFDGNPGLCGHPLPKPCGDDTHHAHPSTASNKEEETESCFWIEWGAVPMGCGCGLVFGISAGYVMLEKRRPRWLARMVERKLSTKANRPKKNVAPRNHDRRRRGTI